MWHRHGIGRQNFKVVITNMFKELKETKLKEFFKSMMTMSHQTESMKKLENFLRNNGILELKSTKIRMKIH